MTEARNALAENVGNELVRAHQAATDKYTYFLLAAAGACIAFGLTQTRDASLSAAHLPLGAAALSWGLSFWFGCARLGHITEHIYLNLTWVRVRAGEDERARSPAQIAVASEVTLEHLEARNRSIAAMGRWQFRFLIIGALFYVGWHVLEMYLRSRGHPAAQPHA